MMNIMTICRMEYVHVTTACLLCLHPRCFIPYPPSIIDIYIFFGKCEEEKNKHHWCTVWTTMILLKQVALHSFSSYVVDVRCLNCCSPPKPIFIWQTESFSTDVWSTLQIHNHPSSSSPSWTDVKCLCNTLPSLAPWNCQKPTPLLPSSWLLDPAAKCTSV